MPLAGLLIVVIAYLLGSIPTGYFLVRLFRKEDIRSLGSGNIGATNVLRSGGKGLGAATFLLDVIKGAAAVCLGGSLAPFCCPTCQFATRRPSPPSARSRTHVPRMAAFQGGKGVATGFGVFLVAAPLAALAAIGLFALILLLTRFVSLASILGAGQLSYFCVVLRAWRKTPPFIAAQIIVALLIIVKHHENIRRLAAGTENRFGARNQERKPA